MGIFKKKKVTKSKAKPKVASIATARKAKVDANPVLAVQKALGIPETGVLDYTTENKIQKFQILNNLPLTGEADEATLAKL